MKFVARHDIDAPLEFVQKVLADFEGWERAAMRRGAEVSRTDKLRQAGPGMSWLTRFPYRSKERVINVQLLALDMAGHMAFIGSSASIEGDVKIDLLEMAAKRTRLHVGIEVKPRTLGARLFLQSLRLARSRVDKSFDARIAMLAADIETRYRTMQRV